MPLLLLPIVLSMTACVQTLFASASGAVPGGAAFAGHRFRSPVLGVAIIASFVLGGFDGGAFGADKEPQPPGQRTAVIVLPFRDDTGGAKDAHWQHGIAVVLRGCLGAVRSLEVLSGNDTGFGMEQVGCKSGDVISVQQARKIGEKVEAQRVVWGSYRRRNQSLQAQLRVAHVSGGEAIGEATVSATNWLELTKALANQALIELLADPSDKERREMNWGWPCSSSALEWFAQAVTLEQEHQPADRQESCIRKALAEDPQYTGALSYLADVLSGLDKNAEGEECARRLIALRPEQHRGHCLLGRFRSLAKDAKGADVAFQEATRLDPRCIAPLGYSARARVGEGKYDEAILLLTRARSLEPKNARLAGELATLYAKKNDKNKAAQLMEETERLARGDPYVEQILVMCAGEVGELGQCLRHARKFLGLARKQKWATNDTAEVEEVLRSIKLVASSCVQAVRPKFYSASELRSDLEKRLAPDELALAVNPIERTAQMNAWARELAGNVQPPLARAILLFDALASRVTVGGKGGTRTAKEVYADWNEPEARFSCQEYAKLFVALARELEIEAYYVHLGRDEFGRHVNHDCAVVFDGDQAILADPTWRKFGVQHKEFHVLNDLQTVAHHAAQPRADGKDLARCRMAKKLHPGDRWTKLQLIRALVNAGQLEPASDELQRSFENQPSDPNWFVAGGLIAAKKNEFQTAIEQLQQALRLDPDNVQAHHYLGFCFVELQNYWPAREQFQKVLDLDDGTNWPEEVGRAKQALTELDQGHRALSGDENSIATLRQRAEAGDESAQLNLGLALLRTPGGKHGPAAVKWITKSAEKGQPQAQFTLGDIYSTGTFVARDDNQAVKWFRLAAAQADSDAQNRLGLAFYEGKGVAKDYVEAHYWLNLASAAGNREAKYALQELELFMTAEQLAQAKQRVEEGQGKRIGKSSLPRAQ
jgi:TPR repeat protein/predicted Zn-dependent protease/TolB-like protein